MKTLVSFTLFLSLASSFLMKTVHWLTPNTAHAIKELALNTGDRAVHSPPFSMVIDSVSIRDTFMIEGDNSSSVDTLLVFVIERQSTASDFRVFYTSCDSSATVIDGDYQSTSGSISFSSTSNKLTDTIRVPVLTDTKVELDEKVSLFLTRIVDPSGMTFMKDSLGIGTIINNDTAYLSIRDTVVTEGNSGTNTLQFTVDFTGELDTMFLFDFSTMDSTAVAPSDYVATGNTLTGSGSGVGAALLRTTTFSILTNGDTKVESNEYVKVMLLNIEAGGRSLVFSDSLGVGTILNDDTASISISDATIVEGQMGIDSIEFVVSTDLEVDSLGIVFETMDSIATVLDNDYLARMDTIYLNCVLEGIIKVGIIGDHYVETDEPFKVILKEIIGGRAATFKDSIGVGTILNDDFAPTIVDPCECLENESSLGAGDGQFAETVTVTSQTGEVWYIASVTGLFRNPTVGSFPPPKGGNPYPLNPFSIGPTGTKLVETPLGNGLSTFALEGIHVNDIGYTIIVTNGVDFATIGNTCHYETACDADQTIVIPFFSGVAGLAKIDDCTANNAFINDGVHAYRDDTIRSSIITICPNVSGQMLSVNFSAFDLAIGDTLCVFDGKDTTAAFIAKGSGNSPADMNGSWVVSNCDPNVNPSGCLTFLLKTNGDNNKGAGWKASVSCSLDGVTILNPPTNVFANASCDSLKQSVKITLPTITSSSTCTINNDSVIVSFCDVRDTLGAGDMLSYVFPFGVYDIHYKLIADTTITASNKVFVSLPPLTCNDTVITAIGQGCVTMVSPDDLLEDPCQVTSQPNIDQYYTIKVETDTGLVTGSSPDFPLLDASKNGNVRCNQFYRVTVIRNLQVSMGSCEQISKDSCSGIIKLIDGIKPVFVGVEEDTIFGCRETDIIQSMLTPPRVIDNCEVDTLIVAIPDNPLGDCNTNNTIVVTWTAIDRCGNATLANQNIVIERPRVLDIPSDTVVNCHANTSPDSIGWPKLDIDGDGIGDHIITSADVTYCDFDLILSEDTIPGLCTTNQTIVRYFTLVDNCTNPPTEIVRDTQLIQIADTIAPSIHCSSLYELGGQYNPYLFKAPYNSCTAIPGPITPPTGSDACDEALEAVVKGIYNTENGHFVAPDFSGLSPLPLGNYRAVYQLKDDCGNTSRSCDIYFNIIDNTIPIAVCTDELRVSMTTGSVTLSPEDISDGTYDFCGIDTMLIRRTVCGNDTLFPTDTNQYVADKFLTFKDANGWTSSIEISCCDLGNTIKVQLLVFDKSGNYNKCWLYITPEDHIQPICSDLPDAEGFCDEFYINELGTSTDANANQAFDDNEWQIIDSNLIASFNAQFGNPNCYDNATCRNVNIEQEYQLIRAHCGIQLLKRRFRSRDTYGAGNASKWYEQNITIKYRPGWSITFPPDTLLECGQVNLDSLPMLPLLVENGTCDLIGWDVKDEKFEGTDGACFKILRHWYVLNGCKQPVNQQAFELPRDQTGDLVLTDSKRTFTANDTVNSNILGDLGYFTYTQLIIVKDFEAPVIVFDDVDTCLYGVSDAPPFNEADQTPGFPPHECDTIRLFSVSATDCTPNDLIDFSYEVFDEGVRVFAGEGKYVFHSVQPGRTYNVRFRAEDNCGNIGLAERTYHFRDCRKPSPACNQLRVNLGTDRRATVRSRDLNSKSYDNCTDSSQLDLRIWHGSLGTAPPTTLEEVLNLPTQITLTCQHLGISTIHLYAIDEAQNYDFCTADLDVRDNDRVCPMLRGRIFGTVKTENGDEVEQVSMHLYGEGAMPEMITTGADGTFSYEVSTGQPYTLTPKKLGNPVNGISTFDIVLIQKHILGIEQFDSPYKYIAADVNGSRSVAAYDMVQLRQMILNIISDFPNNESWKFVNAFYQMQQENPLGEAYWQDHIIENLQTDVQVDFIAVKVGDISGNAKANSLVSSEIRSTNGLFDLHLKDRLLIAGRSLCNRFFY